MMTAVETLKKYWGYSSFRPLQEEIILSVLNGNDTLALLPTGGGKSVCYQVPAMMLDGLTLVISPLIALMKDQVENLKRRGIKAVYVNSSLMKREIELNLNNCMHGGVKLLYLSPERLSLREFQETLVHMPICLVAVDEAHCISQWGYDFRPPYLKIADIRKLVPAAPVIALTATATAEVVSDIQQKLEFRKTNVLKDSFSRSNLSYYVFKEEDKRGRLIRMLAKTKGTAIIYLRSRKQSMEIARFLKSEGFTAGYYHAGLDNAARSARQEEWMSGKIRVMVATNAFGMGIDKADVRLVIHLDLPDSLEAYFQEAGRAGRDGKSSHAVLLFDDSDILKLKSSHEMSFPEPQLIRKVYTSLSNYFQLPVGSGRGQSFDFVAGDFFSSYRISPMIGYTALKFLEKEGYLSIDMNPDQDSRLFVQASHAVLYDFEVTNPYFEPLIKALLRSYGGFFNDFVRINESEIGKRTGLTKAEVVERLKQLDKMNLLTYIQAAELPRLTYLTERLSDQQLRINPEQYFKLKEVALKRMLAVIDFVTTADGCRSSQLLSYFGELNSPVCGHCDLCVLRKKSDRPDNENFRRSILRILENAPCSMSELLGNFPQAQQEKVLEAVGFLLDNKVIRRKESGFLEKA